MNEWRALGVCGATSGSPPDDSPPFTEGPQRHHCTQAGGGSGVWLLPGQGWKLLGEVLWPRAAQALPAKPHAPPKSPHPARRLHPSPTRHRRPRFTTKPAAEPRGPTPSQPAARKSFPYLPPLPGAREHSPLRTVRDSGLPRGRPASAPQLASKRPRRNGSGGGARGAGSARVRRRRERAWGGRRPEEGRGRGCRAARSVPSPGRSGTPSPRLLRLMLPALRWLLLNSFGSWGPLPF